MIRSLESLSELKVILTNDINLLLYVLLYMHYA